MEFTQESVLVFLMEKGGRVRNKDLTDHFKSFLTGAKDTSAAKESFERFVDSIAYVKQESGEKVVYLKKKYQEMKRMKDGDSTSAGNTHNQHQSIHDSEIRFRQDVPFAGKENIPECVEDETLGEKSVPGALGEEWCMAGSGTAQVDLCVSDIALTEVANTDDSCVFAQGKHGNSSEKDKEGCELRHVKTEGASCPTSGKLLSDTEALASRGSLPAQLANRRRTSRGSQRSLLASSDDSTSEVDSLLISGAEVGTPRGSRRSFVELMMSSSPQVRCNLLRRSSQGQMVARRRDSLRSDGDSGSVLSSVDEDCASVTLDPLEHEWMMCASDGEWDNLHRLLTCEPGLVTKKDFVTGFTCLHWAAKQGKHELLALLVTFAHQHSVPVNVNVRSSAGYTPLHLAAMHNHVEVMKLLVGAYDADLEMRDYSGRKPSQYLNSTVTGDIQDIVGTCVYSDSENAEGGTGRWHLSKVLQSNLNPLRLLNPLEESVADGQTKPKSLYRKASIGKIKLNRGRVRTQIVHSTSFRETEEGNRSLKSPVKSRPVSNLFG